jgi:hypothetical protein
MVELAEGGVGGGVEVNHDGRGAVAVLVIALEGGNVEFNLTFYGQVIS